MFDWHPRRVRADRLLSLLFLLQTHGRMSAPDLATRLEVSTRTVLRDVEALSRWCTGDRPTVVAGDLNATLDHAELRDAIDGCTDAASDVGEGLTGTWPSAAPRLLGVQIDHVLTSGGPAAREVEIVDVEGSDHRGVLARVGLG